MCSLKGERFEYEMNMLTDAAISRIPLEAVEIATVYLDNNSESHFNPWWNSLKVYRILLGTFVKYAIPPWPPLWWISLALPLPICCFRPVPGKFCRRRSSPGSFPLWSITGATGSWSSEIRAARPVRCPNTTFSACWSCSARQVWSVSFPFLPPSRHDNQAYRGLGSVSV